MIDDIRKLVLYKDRTVIRYASMDSAVLTESVDEIKAVLFHRPTS